MEDLIRRSDALSCFHDLVSQRGGNALLLLPVYEAIANLPSALPKPHGRLIDADALVKKQPIPELGAPRWLIEQAPTIIPAEEGE